MKIKLNDKWTIKTAELYYEFTYVALKEDETEDEGDNSNSENDWNMGFDEDELPVEFGGFDLSDERWSDYVFLNTVSVKQLRRLPNSTLTSYDGINRVYISPLCPEPFTFRLNVLRKPDANGNRQSDEFDLTGGKLVDIQELPSDY